MAITVSVAPTVETAELIFEGFSSAMTERFIVAGLEGTTARFKMFKAGTVSGIPAMGSQHPNVTDLYVTRKAVRMITQDEAEVVVSYSVPEIEDTAQGDAASFPVRIRVSSAVQGVTTNVDKNGALLSVSHILQQQEQGTGKVHTQNIQQVGTVEIQRPATVVSITRQELGNPAPIAAAYTGFVNRLAFMGAAAREWLCTSIEGESNDGEQSYTVTYTFTNKPGSWDATITAIDPATGQPYPNLIEGVGIRDVSLYPEKDFAELGLPV